ncbi:hypothetical protein DFH11DRAFT_1543338 [Phellopilus nigrolimitatus]|nr:hypothetical protein DFH11DRAFT_1543338 [Phellopilus nigrolimitatus]
MFPRQTLTRAAKTKAAEKAQMSTIEKKSVGEPRKRAFIKPSARGVPIHKGTLSIPPKEILEEWKHKQLSMLAKKIGLNCKGRKEDIKKRLFERREKIEEEMNHVAGGHGDGDNEEVNTSETLPSTRGSDAKAGGVETISRVRAGKRKAIEIESGESGQESTSTPRKQKRQRSSQTQVLADSRVPNQESSLPSSSSGLMRPQDRAVGSRAPSPPEAVTSAVNFRDPEFFTIGEPASSPHSTTGPPNSHPHTSVQGTAQEIIPRIGPLRLVDWEAASYTRRSKEEEEEREDETETEIEEAVARTRPAEDTSTESAERTPRCKTVGFFRTIEDL